MKSGNEIREQRFDVSIVPLSSSNEQKGKILCKDMQKKEERATLQKD